ncbi:MAG: hypothetical protein GX929_07860 [Clostridiales bacterium]|jgi:YbbR domain-containing protein|nr:hypothetical protein [Clostridiales bacterium]
MNAFLKKYHIVMRLFSLLIAAFLWFYVIYQENPERSVTFADVPVRLIGEETLRLRDDLVRTDTETPTVDVRLSGAVSLLNLKAEDIIVRSDVSRITEPGTYTLSYDISAIDGVAVSGRTPSEITVSFDRQVTLDLPVDVVYTGELHESLIADTAIVDPVTVRITGIESEISSARYAQVTVDASSLASSFSGDLSYTVVDEEGEELSDNTYEKLDDTVHVEIPVYRERELPLKVELLYGNAALPSNSILTLSRDTVSVYGDIATVDALTELKIDTIDLSVQLGDFEKIYTLSLPDGVYLKDSANDTVTVHVGFVDLEVRQIVVTDIRIENIPVRYSVSADTSEVYVTVRGSKEMLDGLISGDISLVADLTDVKLINGMQTVPAKVRLRDNVSTLGVFGEYTIVINSGKLSNMPIFS